MQGCEDPRLGRLCVSVILEDDDVLWILDMTTQTQTQS